MLVAAVDAVVIEDEVFKAGKRVEFPVDAVVLVVAGVLALLLPPCPAKRPVVGAFVDEGLVKKLGAGAGVGADEVG